jgi:hypothetical protein
MKRLAAFLPLAILACGAKTGLPIWEYPADASVSSDASALVCTPGRLRLERARPMVMMVLDRSGSMAKPLGATLDNRWQILTRALATTMPSVDETMEIGALLFPAGATAELECGVPSAPELSPALGNVARLIERMRTERPAGGTPTADALDASSLALSSRRATRAARAMVLATDGAPSCNKSLDLDPRTCRCTLASCERRPDACLDDARTNAVLEWHAKRGLPTYVIGIAAGAPGSFPDVLDAMAIAGGRPKTSGGHRFYGADSEVELNAALVAIRDQVGVCEFLTTSVPDAYGSVTILVDGVPADGWRWIDQPNGHLELTGDACTRAAASGAKVEAIVECSDAG